MIIGITGGTASGKTTLVSAIVAELNLENVCVISQDCYYKKTTNLSHKERMAQNFDHPDAIDFDLLATQLQALKDNKPILQPVYSFITHNRTSAQKTIVPKKIIIVEGILIFNDKRILDLLDLTIFIHADAEERLRRRIYRDSKERGRDMDEVLKRYKTTLKPMHNLYIEPFRSTSDFVFDNTEVTQSISKNIINIIQERTVKTHETN